MQKENVVAVAAFETVGAASGVWAFIIAAPEVQADILAADEVDAPIPTGDDEEGTGKRLVDWDMYKEEPDIASADPYDTSTIEHQSEVTRVWSLHFMLILASRARI
jgi:hypothetical protein